MNALTLSYGGFSHHIGQMVKRLKSTYWSFFTPSFMQIRTLSPSSSAIYTLSMICHKIQTEINPSPSTAFIVKTMGVDVWMKSIEMAKRASKGFQTEQDLKITSEAALKLILVFREINPTWIKDSLMIHYLSILLVRNLRSSVLRRLAERAMVTICTASSSDCERILEMLENVRTLDASQADNDKNAEIIQMAQKVIELCEQMSVVPIHNSCKATAAKAVSGIHRFIVHDKIDMVAP